MRNLKKLLAVVVTIAMIATFAIPAFAADAAKTDATIVTDLGMLKGTGADGVTDAYLATQPDRLQAAIMFLRLLGKEADAKAFTGTDNFVDAVGLSAENTAILGYLKANPGLGYEGIGENKFDPTTKMTAKAYYKVMLVALGYAYGTDAAADFTWDNVLGFAAGKGLTKNIDVSTFKVSDLAAATVEALKATPKGGTGTLLAALVADGKVAEAAAVASGLYTVPVIALAIGDVTADNLVEVVVPFNKAVDEDTAEDETNYDISGATIDSASLGDDGKTVTLGIDLADPLVNGDEYDLTVTGVKDADGTEIDEASETFTVADNSMPVATALEFTGPQTIKVTLSEPISEDDSNPEISIDDGTYGSVDPTDFDGDKEITIDLGTELDAGAHKIKVKGFTDFVPNNMPVKTFDVTYAAIETAPTVTVDEATQSKVTLKFNRPVKNIDTTDFYQSYSTWHPIEVQDGDGNVISNPNTDYDYNGDGSETQNLDEYYDKVVLIFTDAATDGPIDETAADRPLPTGNTKIVTLAEGENANIEDRWENELDKDVTLTAAISADEVAPTVTKVTFEDESQIKVYFSEDVLSGDAQDEENYLIKNSDGDETDSADYVATYSSADDEYVATIDFDSALDAGKYTIKISGISDVSLSANELEAVTKEFTVTDKTAISFDDVEATDVYAIDASHIVYVAYPEDMATSGQYSVLEKDNYRFDTDGAGALDELPDGVKLSMFSSKIVKFQFPNDTDSLLGARLQIARVADLAGNKMLEYQSDIYTIAEEVPPTITEVKKVATKKFELKVSGELKSVKAAGIQFSDDSGVTYDNVSSISYVNDGSDTIIKVTVNGSEESTGTAAPATTFRMRTVAGTGNIKSITGKALADAVYSNAGGTWVDGMAPELATDLTDDEDDMVYAYDEDSDNHIDSVYIKYSEAISAGSVSKYTYTVNGYDVTAVTVINQASFVNAIADPGGDVSGVWVRIVLDEDTDHNDTDKDVSVTQKYAITDTSDNELAAQDAVKAIDYQTVSAAKMAQ